MAQSAYVMEPPEGEVRTVDNPPSQGAGIIPAAVVTTVIAFIVVGLRVFTRTYLMRGSLGLDDYLVLLSLALSIAFCGFSIRLAHLGCGRHMWDMPLSDYSPPYLATTLGITMTYCTTVSSAKLSILVFYLRLSPQKPFRIAVYALIGIVVAYTLSYIITILLLCKPIELNWDITVKGTCISRLAPMMVLSVANIFIDVAILVIPIRVVIPLQMPRRQKLSLLLLFATGGFVCAAAIYRTYILPDLINSADYTWKNPPQNVWGSIEANTGILCASVPTLKPFFMRYLPAILSSRMRSRDASSKPSSYGAFSTKVERNRRRRQDQSYELSSRDNAAPRNSFPIQNLQDDEVMLKPHDVVVEGRGHQSSESDDRGRNIYVQNDFKVSYSVRDDTC